MPRLLTRIDRRLAISGLVVLASILLLVVGLVSTFAALNGDEVDLPSEGTLDEILEDRETVQAAAPTITDQDAPTPTRLGIPGIGVEAEILAMGLDANSYPEVPNAGDEVAWYTFSSPPGGGSNAVFSGHVDWFYWGMPAEGVFYHLRELKIGDKITVGLEDGSELRYSVTGNVATTYDDPNVVDVMDATSSDVITLITCGGTWSKDYSNPNGGNYSHRVIVRAERILDLASGQAATGN